MLTAPVGMILQPFKSGTVIARDPPTDGLFVNQQNASDLSVALSLRRENQGVVTLSFR
jgi:hypothetical protein